MMNTYLQRYLALIALALGLLLFSSVFSMASAHQFSTAYMAIQTDGKNATITAEYRLAVRDLALVIPLDPQHNGVITWGALETQTPAIQQLLVQNLQWQANGKACRMNPAREPMALDQIAGLSYVVSYLSISCDHAPANQLDYRMLAHIDSGHRVIMSSSNLASDASRSWLIAPGVVSLAPEDGSLWHTFNTYMKEGIHHILTGYDHLLFLLCLLLPAVYVRREEQWIPVDKPLTAIRHTLYIATAFTLAHSITLTVAALNLVSLPSRWGESAIAFSIALAALNNLLPMLGTRYIRLAFFFGLIHGFGFATALSDLPISTASRITALFSFNFGIELGQITCILIFLPIALALRKLVFYRQVMLKTGSMVACCLALLWMTQRIFDLNWIPG
jgi:hypothetical protein